MTGSNGKDGGIEIVSSETFTLPSGLVLKNVHSAAGCKGRWCVIHHPMPHGMSDWTLTYRRDRGIFERICPECGCGHYDNSQLEYHLSIGQEWQSIHGCCEHGWSRHGEVTTQEEE